MKWVALCAATLVCHYGIHQHNQIKSLQLQVQLSDKARDIESDEVRDLMYALQASRTESESKATQGYVAGLIEFQSKPEHYTGVWHDGYDRGTEVEAESNRVLAESVKTLKTEIEITEKPPSK